MKEFFIDMCRDWLGGAILALWFIVIGAVFGVIVEQITCTHC